jgi:PKD repeat protein
MIPEGFVEINVTPLEADVVLGGTISVEIEVTNSGNMGESLSIDISLPEGWSSDHRTFIKIGPRVTKSFTANFTVPVDADDTSIVLHLNGSKNQTFSYVLGVQTPLPVAGILSFDEAPSVTMINFVADLGPIDNWTWTFGDGEVAYGEVVSHSFARPGVYSITLTIVNEAGVDRAYKNVTILNTVPIITIDPVSGVKQDDIVHLSAAGSTDPDGTIVEYLWEFPDGSTAEGAVVSHKFDSKGQNFIILKVTDDSGGINRSWMNISVASAEEGLAFGDLVLKIGMTVGILIIIILIILISTGRIVVWRKAKKKEPTEAEPKKAPAPKKRPPAGGAAPGKKAVKRPKGEPPKKKKRKVKEPDEEAVLEAKPPFEEQESSAEADDEVKSSAFVPKGERSKPVLPSTTRDEEGPADEASSEATDEDVKSAAFVPMGARKRNVLPTASEPEESPAEEPEAPDVPGPDPPSDGPSEPPEPMAEEEIPDQGGTENVDDTEISQQLDDLDALMKKLHSYSDDEE